MKKPAPPVKTDPPASKPAPAQPGGAQQSARAFRDLLRAIDIDDDDAAAIRARIAAAPSDDDHDGDDDGDDDGGDDGDGNTKNAG
jgi:hypothetical protein